jgi:hypothetical protein
MCTANAPAAECATDSNLIVRNRCFLPARTHQAQHTVHWQQAEAVHTMVAAILANT